MSKKETETKSSQGQGAKEISLSYDELTKNEQKVVLALAQEGRPVLTIKELVEACGWKSLKASGANEEFKGKARGNSRVRNSLRRLVQGTWVENYPARGSGKYRLTAKAAKRLKRADVKIKKSDRARTKPEQEADQIAF